jgi:hypothetical protein
MGKVSSTLLWSLVLAFPSAHAANYATCVLDKMPGTQNFAVHQAVVRECLASYPTGFLDSIKGSGRGIFGFSGRDSCIKKKAANTSFNAAAGAISAACHCLYEKPEFPGEMCAYKRIEN